MEELEFFVMVVAEQGFTAAAARLDTTPAAVSRRIKALEQRLGVRLLQRTTRRVELTEAGELYYREVSRFLKELRGVETQLASLTGQPRGDLKIVAPMSFGQRCLGSLLPRFAAEHPALRITLKLEDQQTDIVAQGFDVALRIAYPSDASYVARPISSIARYFCASPEYLERRGTPVAPRDLLKHDCLHYNLISEREEWTFRANGGEETLSIRGTFCSNNGDILAEAATQGMGVALLPDFIVAERLSDGRLVRVLERFERDPLTLFALYPSRHFVPMKTRLFVDYLIENFAE